MEFNVEDLQRLRDQCNMILSNVSEKEKMDNIISQYHNYSIWEANDGYWRTYIMIDGKRKLIKKKSKDKLIEHLENHYKKLKPHNIAMLIS